MCGGGGKRQQHRKRDFGRTRETSMNESEEVLLCHEMETSHSTSIRESLVKACVIH